MATQKKPLNLFLFFETIRRRANSKVCLFTFLSLFLFLSLFFYSFRDLTYTTTDLNFSPILPPINDELTPLDSYLGSTFVINSVSILLPDWEVLLILSPQIVVPSRDTLCCVYANNATSPAIFAGYLPSTNETMFKCTLTESARRRKSLFQPVLLSGSPEKILAASFAEAPAMMKWSFMAYDSLSTESDVVLFVKGINNRQGTNRSPAEFRCVFGNNSVKTAVTSSTQEVFRCSHPNLTEEIDYLGGDKRIKISLEISGKGLVVPSVAYYTQPLRLVNPRKKSLLCACTMVYNVAKFLREWVVYHSKIGVNRFILYDNNSDDDLQRVVKDLNKEGYHVQTLLWIWPKTQEAGFSHAVIYAKSLCDWMMYLDVDEFVFSPSWYNSKHPSQEMLLKTLLPRNARWSPHRQIGQVLLSCNEFGPSGKKSHPIEGVMRGYTCRRKDENRHKSIVLLDAVDDTLINAIHHFGLKKNYRTKHVSMEVGLVNHYKYQAWPEFKAKFRRRVSAYVVDWTKDVNMRSKDRTPGLGFEPIEPQGWARKFCEVRDERLKLLTRRWFGNQTFQLALEEHHRGQIR